ncbi:MAG: hypothetical protein DKT66_04890, partial [Candidatus Melainabacteria bacterium]
SSSDLSQGPIYQDEINTNSDPNQDVPPPTPEQRKEWENWADRVQDMPGPDHFQHEDLDTPIDGFMGSRYDEAGNRIEDTHGNDLQPNPYAPNYDPFLPNHNLWIPPDAWINWGTLT